MPTDYRASALGALVLCSFDRRRPRNTRRHPSRGGDGRVGDAAAEGVRRVRPTQAWLGGGDREAHLLGALAFCELWKSHQDGRPGIMVMTDDRGQEYIRVADGDRGPELAVVAP
jgi:hypothetical protein